MFGPRFPYCVVTIAIRVVNIAILLPFIPFFCWQLRWIKKAKLAEKEAKSKKKRYEIEGGREGGRDSDPFQWFQLQDKILPEDFSILRANKFILLFRPVWVGCLTTCKSNIPKDTDTKFAKWGLSKTIISRNDLPKIRKQENVRPRLQFRTFGVQI